MSARIIRFPAYVDLREPEAPMATRLSWFQRLLQWPKRQAKQRANVAKLRIERARKGACT